MDLPSVDEVRASLFADSLADYMVAAWPMVEHHPFRGNWHITAIAEHLEAVSRRDIKRLIINIPPGHMKSLSVGVFWPTWEWLSRPHTRFMFTSYAQQLTARDSLKCRRIIETLGGTIEGSLLQRLGYQGLLALIGSDWKLTSDQREKMKFENTEFGYRIATSIGGMGTGEGGDILVIDDPHKADEVESDVERQNVIDWFDGTLSTRLRDPNGGVVLVMQRLHEQDATGHLLSQGGWEHLCLPAEYEAKHPFVWPSDPRTEEGELLWPTLFNRERLDELKVKLGHRASGQLQQRPSPAEGFMFKRTDFKYWRVEMHDFGGPQSNYILPAENPEDASRSYDTGLCPTFQVVDPAISSKQTADWSVCATFRSTVDGDLLLIDLERVRFEQQDLVMFLMHCSDKYNRPPMWIEPLGAGRQPLSILTRAGYPIMAIPLEAGTKSDKVTRAFGAVAAYKQHKIFHPPDVPWLGSFEDELCVFDKGLNDDQVDVMSYAARLLPMMGGHRQYVFKPPLSRPITAGIMSETF
jgi:phage terminase large subunit-like protein